MFPIQEVTDVDFAFSTNVNKLMPAYKDIPEEFKGYNNKWVSVFEDMFFLGKRKQLIPREGIDEKKAMRHIMTVMRSFEPKHEYKTAACAFLFNEWFSGIVEET